jgi:hypothetical protein
MDLGDSRSLHQSCWGHQRLQQQQQRHNQQRHRQQQQQHIKQQYLKQHQHQPSRTYCREELF